jgi:hypothetical protein
MSGPFKMKGWSPLNFIEQPKTQRAKYTKSRQNRAFGEGVSAREGAKLMRTSTWRYNKMKKDWLRGQKKKKKEASISSGPAVVTDVTGGTGSDWMKGKTGNKVRIAKKSNKT